jgi:hypothetical protein
MDSRCSKDSSEILFAIFGCRDQKIWIFEDSDQIWFQNLIRVSVLTRSLHVAWSDKPVPVRPDRLCLPLDQKKIWRLRSLRTPSGKWVFRGCWIKIWGSRRRGERELTEVTPAARSAALGSTPWWFWRFRRQANKTTAFRKRWWRRWCAGLGFLLPVSVKGCDRSQ